MRKSVLLLAVLVALFSFAGIAGAQDSTPIELGTWTEGEITSDELELKFTFEGSEGDVVLVEALPKPGTYDLDPEIVLRDSDGDVIGTNDDFGYPLSVIAAVLEADDEYVVLITRSGGEDGSSEGEFWLRVSIVEPVESGAEIEATISSVAEDDIPAVFVMAPEDDVTIELGFEQEVSELYGSVSIAKWEDDSFGGTQLLSLDNSAGVSNATFTVDLEGGEVYVLIVKRSTWSFVFDEMENVITLTVE